MNFASTKSHLLRQLTRRKNYACVSFLVYAPYSVQNIRKNRQVDSHEPRTFCRTVRRVIAAGKVKDGKSGAEGKPSLNRALKN